MRRDFVNGPQLLHHHGKLLIRGAKGLGDTLWTMAVVEGVRKAVGDPTARHVGMVVHSTTWNHYVTNHAPFDVFFRDSFLPTEKTNLWKNVETNELVPMVKASLTMLIPKKRPTQQMIEAMGFPWKGEPAGPTIHAQLPLSTTHGSLGLHTGEGWKFCQAIHDLIEYRPVFEGMPVREVPTFQDKEQLVAWILGCRAVVATEGFITTLCAALDVPVVAVLGGRWHHESFAGNNVQPVSITGRLRNCEAPCNAWVPRRAKCQFHIHHDKVLACFAAVQQKDIQRGLKRLLGD